MIAQVAEISKNAPSKYTTSALLHSKKRDFYEKLSNGQWDTLKYSHPYLALRSFAHWCWVQQPEHPKRVGEMIEKSNIYITVINYFIEHPTDVIYITLLSQYKDILPVKSTPTSSRAASQATLGATGNITQCTRVGSYILEQVVEETRPVHLSQTALDLFIRIVVHDEDICVHANVHHRLQKLVREGLLEKQGKGYTLAQNYRAKNFLRQLYRKSGGNTPMSNSTEVFKPLEYDVMRLINDTTGASYVSPQEEYSACCPFHGEKHPSFSMRYDGVFYCHMCQMSGSSLFDYVALLHPEFEDDLEVLDFLYFYSSYAKGRVTFPHSMQLMFQKRGMQQVDEERYRLNLEAAQRYYDQDFEDDSVMTDFEDVYSSSHVYMFGRGFTQETLEHFRVAVWELFRNHPVFIPAAFNGEAYGYIQRRIDIRAYPKYLVMPGMHKQEHIYGECPGHRTIGLVVEGPTDLMMAWQYGWKDLGLFMILGKSVSDAQMLELSLHCDAILGGFDNDTAGWEAYCELQEKAHHFGIPVYPVHWPSKDICLLTFSEFWLTLLPVLEEGKRGSPAISRLVKQMSFARGEKIAPFS